MYDVAVVGATGLVGETLLSILDERRFPVRKLFAVASHRSKGKDVVFQGAPILVEDIETFDFSQVQLAFFSAGASVSEKFVPKVIEAGAWVVDNTSQFRMNPEVPLIVPEVNRQAMNNGYAMSRLIANPNCSTIQMVVALKPIYDAVGITRINVVTFQSVSGTGRRALTELVGQTSRLLNGQPIETEVYPHQIAFNVLPHIDQFQSNGFTKEEMKMVNETRKIFGDHEILVNPTAVRVPVFYGHSEALHIETREKISVTDVRSLLSKAPGVQVIDDPDALEYPLPIHERMRDDVLVGRIRADLSHPNGIDMWVVADNIRKGAALNAIQIAEYLLETKRL